jgi:hypothetical protein
MEEISGATIEDGILRYQVPISSWAQCVFVEEVGRRGPEFRADGGRILLVFVSRLSLRKLARVVRFCRKPPT